MFSIKLLLSGVAQLMFYQRNFCNGSEQAEMKQTKHISFIKQTNKKTASADTKP